MKSSTGAMNSYLKDLREKSGKTQKEASDFLGHSTAQYISNLERGLCSASVEMALRLTEFYGGKPKDLYELMLKEYEVSLKARFKKKRA